jgi:carboxypeptidase C (cathepsin A)
LPAAQRAAIAAKMHAFIGLDASYIERANLRIDPSRFEKELLRDRARTVGRLDGRYVGIDSDAAGESPEYDPSDTAVGDLITGAFNGYVRNELQYRSETDYKGTNYGVVNRGWNFRRGNSYATANVADDLRQALTKNPALRVFSANGYYDLATPFFGTEHTLGHLGLDPTLQGHITYGFYDSGHMIYMNTAAREATKRDLARFYDSALAR